MTTTRRPTARTIRRSLAGVATTLTVARVLLWAIKAIATAGTVDSALQVLGLHGPVDVFEDTMDGAIIWLYDVLMRASDLMFNSSPI
jgi:hypothetical protein